MVHGVFALMNICLIADLRYALQASVQIMSADGSWSVCTHEHLPHRFLLLCACYSASHVSRWFMEVFALMNIWTDRCSLDSALATALVAVGRWFMECLHS
jgi:hypothetical protein